MNAAFRCVAPCLLALALPTGSAAADDAAPPAAPASEVTVADLRAMSQGELDDLYVRSSAGPMPNGDSEGTAVFFPGSILNTPSTLLAALVWQGKVFDTDQGVLVNKVFGFRAIKARLYFGESLFDGKNAIIIDYSRTSLLAHAIRDEVRLVAPDLYLGRAYMRTVLGDYMVVNFILDFGG